MERGRGALRRAAPEGCRLNTASRRAVVIAGVDGVGKTTLISEVQKALSAEGIRTRYVWLRFNHRLALLPLAYARARKLTHYETRDGATFGYQRFAGSTLLRWTYPWCVWLDVAARLAWARLLARARREVLLIDRLAVDLIVDMSLAFEEPTFAQTRAGRALLRLVPRDAPVVVLSCDPKKIIERRPELAHDRTFFARVELYEELARRYEFAVVRTDQPLPMSTSMLREVSGL